jgi:hypothetical protein
MFILGLKRRPQPFELPRANDDRVSVQHQLSVQRRRRFEVGAGQWVEAGHGSRPVRCIIRRTGGGGRREGGGRGGGRRRRGGRQSRLSE